MSDHQKNSLNNTYFEDSNERVFHPKHYNRGIRFL